MKHSEKDGGAGPLSVPKDTSLELAKPRSIEIALLRKAKGLAASSAVEAVTTLVDLMRNSPADKIRLEAAKAILERGVGRTKEEFELPPVDVMDVSEAEIEEVLREDEPGKT